MDTVVEAPKKLPPGFEVVERSDKKLTIGPDELPWVKQPEPVQLAAVIVRGIGRSFYYASAVRGDALTEAADQLDRHRSEVCNNLLYTNLPSFVEGRNANISVVDNASTKRRIYYVGNKGGQRVYFIRFDNLGGIPVIIRVAACDKSQQLGVLRVLTTSSAKQIKMSGRL